MKSKVIQVSLASLLSISGTAAFATETTLTEEATVQNLKEESSANTESAEKTEEEDLNILPPEEEILPSTLSKLIEAGVIKEQNSMDTHQPVCHL